MPLFSLRNSVQKVRDIHCYLPMVPFDCPIAFHFSGNRGVYLSSGHLLLPFRTSASGLLAATVQRCPDASVTLPPCQVRHRAKSVSTQIFIPSAHAQTFTFYQPPTDLKIITFYRPDGSLMPVRQLLPWQKLKRCQWRQRESDWEGTEGKQYDCTKIYTMRKC